MKKYTKLILFLLIVFFSASWARSCLEAKTNLELAGAFPVQSEKRNEFLLEAIRWNAPINQWSDDALQLFFAENGSPQKLTNIKLAQALYSALHESSSLFESPSRSSARKSTRQRVFELRGLDESRLAREQTPHLPRYWRQLGTQVFFWLWIVGIFMWIWLAFNSKGELNLNRGRAAGLVGGTGFLLWLASLPFA